MMSDRFCMDDNSLVKLSAEETAALNKRDGIVPWTDEKNAWVNAKFHEALDNGTDFDQADASAEYDRLHAQGKV